MIETRELTRRFGAVVAVDRLSLAIAVAIWSRMSLTSSFKLPSALSTVKGLSTPTTIASSTCRYSDLRRRMPALCRRAVDAAQLVDDDHDDVAVAGSGSSTTSPTSLAGDATTHNDGCSERHVDCVSPGDRQSHRGVLGPVRFGGRRMGGRDRMAREQLSTGRGESHWLLLDLPNGVATAQRHLRGGWLSRLVRGTLRRQGLDSGRSVAVCVLGLVTLAALIWQVL